MRYYVVAALETFKSTCSYCGVGCGVIVEKNGSNEIRIHGDEEHPANRGLLCSKGLNLHYATMDQSDRITHPMMRAGGRDTSLQKISWDSALSKIASQFKQIIAEHGPNSVGFYVSGQLLTEEYYIINKLTKGFLGTNNIDTNSRLCMSSAVVGYKMALGEDSVPVSYEDIEIADCFLISGANPAWCHPILFRRIEARKKANPDVKIIVVDPRKTESCEGADLHLQIHPGSDIHLFHGIARILIENGWIDKKFIEEHTEGFEDLKAKVLENSLESVAQVCGIPVNEIIEAAIIISKSKGFLSLWAMGLNQSVIGVNKNLALLNLSLITGKIGKPGSGPFSLTGQPNAMGGREVGGLCNLLPAHRNLNDPAHRQEVADFWGVKSIQAEAGYSATEMFENLRTGKMKAIWIVCTNPTVSLPDARTVEAGLRNAELVVVQDISLDSGSVEFADFVLPAAGWAEKQGTMTNSDRRITYLPKIIEAPGEAKPDAWIIQEFAYKMGYRHSFSYESEEDIFLEHAKLTKNTRIDISGLDYKTIQENRSVQWPYPHKGHGGTKRLFSDHIFYRPNGRAKLSNVERDDSSEMPTADFPLLLTTGRIRDQWHTMTKTGKVKKLREHRKEATLEIHPSDATRRRISDGQIVDITNARGTVRVKATLTDSIKPGVVFLPMHWGKRKGYDQSRANNLTSSAFDPFSKQPGFKISAVEVIPYKKEHAKVLVIGGGNGCLAFLKAYRSLAPYDDITVVCKEKHPFYNRILLPDLISGEKNFDQLQGIDEHELKAWNINILPETSVVELLPEGKKVRDSSGVLHSYNKLVIATGSSASLPTIVPQGMLGVFSLRAKTDADRIKGFFVPDTHALIVGGGLLSLELAQALNSYGVKVTILVRNERLMSKQLDSTGSDILREEIEARGIRILFNSQIAKVFGDTRLDYVKLGDGTTLEADGIVFAMGTQPNVNIAKNTNLEWNSGIKVNDYLQTSDLDIYAIGEVAEHSSGLYGTVAATEDQANIAAQHIYGYANDSYSGSLHSNILKIPGLDLVSIRLPGIALDGSDGDLDEITLLDRRRKKYQKCLIKGDKLVGAILIGDKSKFVEFKTMIASGVELGEKRDQLLGGAGNLKPLLGQLVCACNGVGTGNITEAIDKGIHSLAGITDATAAGSGCGSCRPEVAKILRQKLATSSSAN